jgi:uridine kinase
MKMIEIRIHGTTNSGKSTVAMEVYRCLREHFPDIYLTHNDDLEFPPEELQEERLHYLKQHGNMKIIIIEENVNKSW